MLREEVDPAGEIKEFLTLNTSKQMCQSSMFIRRKHIHYSYVSGGKLERHPDELSYTQTMKSSFYWCTWSQP